VSDPGWMHLKQLADRAGGFSPEAIEFIREGLGHTVKMVHGDEIASTIPTTPAEEESRHITGQQLCMGLRDFAIKRYGLLARTVLARWNINRTEDFGRLVFAMIDGELMRKNEGDTAADFENVFDFDEAFSNLQAS
jgi:uncharacterized repeat protein (TIGR04138 family)